MYLKCTPALAIAAFSTAVLLLWFAVDTATANTAPTVWTNTLTMACMGVWLYWFGGQRQERQQRRAAALQDAAATIRAVKSS